MDFLCEVNGPVDLGAGIQVLKSESFATPVLQFDEIKEEPLDMLFQAYQESVSRPETNINEADGHLAIEINYNESRIECLESELKEKKDSNVNYSNLNNSIKQSSERSFRNPKS